MKQSTKLLFTTLTVWVLFFLNILSFNFGWLANIHAIMFIYFGLFTFVIGILLTMGWIDDDS